MCTSKPQTNKVVSNKTVSGLNNNEKPLHFNIKTLEQTSTQNELNNTDTAINAEKHDDHSGSLKLYKLYKLNNLNRIVLAHLNVNSIRNKFEALKEIVGKNIDILMISETTLDDSFPLNQFHIPDYVQPFRLDRSSEGGGILVYIRDDIPAKILKKHPLPKCCEGMFIELNLRKSKWLIFTGYNPQKERISTFLKDIEKSLYRYIAKYDNIILLGDFNSETNETEI